MDKILLDHAPSGGTAEVYLHGAHVTSWRPVPGEADALFLSSRSRFETGQAIRGGIPVILPQFADRGPYARHGFARTSEWSLASRAEDGHAATLRLEDTPATRALWPFPFRAELTVSLGARTLDVALAVENPGCDALDFTAALHSYLHVDDVRAAAVVGLAGAAYESRTEGVDRAVERADELCVSGELDRVYFDVRRPLELRGAAGGRTLRVRGAGFPDVVLWNPGEAKARALTDLGEGEWSRMLCVEAAVVGTPVRLETGGRWEGRQTLGA
jgi:glucose-6-phosphate 1-epimerase